MTVHIIASGESAQHWDGTGPSIGCNDAFKWGHKIDRLVLLNTPGQFQASRLDVITRTNPEKVYTNTPSAWSKYFNQVIQVALRRWHSGEPIKKNVYYHSNTSPFVALSIAYQLGFTSMVMWGVDLVNHHRYGRGQSAHTQEMMKYDSFIKALKQNGVEVFIGANGTAFDNILPVWEKISIQS